MNKIVERIEREAGVLADRTARLPGNRKERLVVSGIGSERLCAKF